MNSYHHRQAEIAQVLARYGLSELLDHAGLARLVPPGPASGGRAGLAPEPPPVALRRALEDLGPSFIKIGQLLSTRADLLSEDYQLELSKLQDAAPRLPFEVVRQVIEEELPGGIEGCFASFDAEPLAAASIGQVHAATLADGTEVAVKVRRPGVVEAMEQDLEILRNAAVRTSRHWQLAARYGVVGLAEEAAATLRAELDYLEEARNATRLAVNFEQVPEVRVPRVFGELTTSRVITLERLRGMKITDLEALDSAGVDRHELAVRLTRLIAKMVFEDGFFHADPHPGNFFVEESGRIGLVDFGRSGTLDDELREQLRRLVSAVVRRDSWRLAEGLLSVGISSAGVDRRALTDDLGELLGTYGDRPLGDLALGSVAGDLLRVARRHGLRVPRELALLLTVLLVYEGLAADLDPGFRLSAELAPYVRRRIADQLSPEALVGELRALGSELAELGAEAPRDLMRLLEQARSGGVEVRMHSEEIAELVRHLDRLGRRMVAATVGAAALGGLVDLVSSGPASARRRLTAGAALATAAGLAGYGSKRWLVRRGALPAAASQPRGARQALSAARQRGLTGDSVG